MDVRASPTSPWPTHHSLTALALGAPLAAGDQGAAHVIVSTRLLEEVGERLAHKAQTAPMELVILNPSYQPFKKFLKHPVKGWSFQDYTP